MGIKKMLSGGRIRYQLFRHLLVGSAGVLFNWLMFSSMRTFANCSTLYATLWVHILLILLIFPLQKFFTFQQNYQGRQQVLRFLINAAAYVLLDFLLAALFIDRVGLSPFVGKGFGLAILTPISFFSQKYWVFSSQLKSAHQLISPVFKGPPY